MTKATSGSYTIADLQKMKEENQVLRAAHEMYLMDQMGADVYFAVKDSSTDH